MPSDWLHPGEVEKAVQWLHRCRNYARSRKRKGERWRVKLNVFHLATSLGLRASEILGLDIEDLAHLSIQRPYVFVPADITKGLKGKRHARQVPATWSPYALPDLREHLKFRLEMGAKPADPFICSLEARSAGRRLNRWQVLRFFKSACKPLGRKRIYTHMGRHTFATSALASKKFAVQNVQQALGHRSLKTTTVYAHPIDDEDGDGQLFNYGKKPA
jgi:site-specific recombinase XerC